MAESIMPVRRSVDGKRAHVRHVATSAASQLAGPPPAPQPAGVEKLNDDLRAAMSRETDAQALHELASHANVLVVREVAQNRSTADGTLHMLAITSEDAGVRALVAQNPVAHELTLGALGRDRNIDVRCRVAANHGTGFDTLLALTTARATAVRELAVHGALRNGSLPGARLTADQLRRAEDSTALPERVKAHIRDRAEQEEEPS